MIKLYQPLLKKAQLPSNDPFLTKSIIPGPKSAYSEQGLHQVSKRSHSNQNSVNLSNNDMQRGVPFMRSQSKSNNVSIENYNSFAGGSRDYTNIFSEGIQNAHDGKRRSQHFKEKNASPKQLKPLSFKEREKKKKISQLNVNELVKM